MSELGIASIWSSLLNVPDVKRGDNFFSLGGDSLLAIEAKERLERHFGIVLELEDVLFFSDLVALALTVDKKVVV